MNFLDAVKAAYENPAGSEHATAIHRTDGRAGIVFYDRSLFLGEVEFGLRHAKGRSDDAYPYSPTYADIMAEDWEVVL